MPRPTLPLALLLVLAATAVGGATAAPVAIPASPTPTRAILQAAIDAEVTAGRDPHLQLPPGDFELDDWLVLPPTATLEEAGGGQANLKWTAAFAATGPAKPMLVVSKPDAYFVPVPELWQVEEGADDPTTRQRNPEQVEIFTGSLTLRGIGLFTHGTTGGHPAVRFGRRSVARPFPLRRVDRVYDPTSNLQTGTTTTWFNGTHTTHEHFVMKNLLFERVRCELGTGNDGATCFDFRPGAYHRYASPVHDAATGPSNVWADSEYALVDPVFRQCNFRLRSTGQAALVLGAPSYRPRLEQCAFDLTSGGAYGLVVKEHAETPNFADSSFAAGSDNGGAIVVHAAASLTMQTNFVTGSAVQDAYALRLGGKVRGATVQNLAVSGGWFGIQVQGGAYNVELREVVARDLVSTALSVLGAGTERVGVHQGQFETRGADDTLPSVLLGDGARRVTLQGCTITRKKLGVALEVRGNTTSEVEVQGSWLNDAKTAVLLRAPATVRQCQLGASEAAVFLAASVSQSKEFTRILDNTARCESGGSSGNTGHVFYLEAQLANALISSNIIDTTCAGRDSVYTPQVVQAFLERGTIFMPNASQPFSGQGGYFRVGEQRSYLSREAPP